MWLLFVIHIILDMKLFLTTAFIHVQKEVILKYSLKCF